MRCAVAFVAFGGGHGAFAWGLRQALGSASNRSDHGPPVQMPCGMAKHGEDHEQSGE